jgi:hypothetical protein
MGSGYTLIDRIVDAIGRQSNLAHCQQNEIYLSGKAVRPIRCKTPNNRTQM